MIDSIRREFEQVLQHYCDSLPDSALYHPVKYILSLGGKRIRPILVVLSSRAFGGDDKVAYHGALAIEIFHNFSLVHDDIMDEAPLRRGNETVHSKWNDNAAILSGDAMLIEAYKQIAQTGVARLAEVLQVFNTTSIEVCEGQQRDMDFEQRTEVGVDEYIEMIRLKTAVLIGCALEIGAMLAGADERDACSLYEFGKLAGLGFQLQDDYLDAFGDPERFGKQVGGDIISNKKTFLSIRALEKAQGDKATELRSIIYDNAISNSTEKVDRVISIYRNLEIDKETRQKSAFYFESAREALSEVSLSHEQKTGFRELLAFLEGRKT
ncbi:MAG: polyprenyl synthetase family protein [Cryomorphaceae bacterium]